MNLSDIKRRVIEMVPGLSDVKITQTDLGPNDRANRPSGAAQE